MATRGIEHQGSAAPEMIATLVKSTTIGKKRKIASSEGAADKPLKGAPPGKKAKTAQHETSAEKPKDQKPPRALLVMYKQVLAHPDYTTVIDKANPTIINQLATRYKNVNGVESFDSSRKHNRLLRCVWKYLHQKDPVLLEEAIALVTPKPQKAKNGGNVTLGEIPQHPAGEDDDDDDEDEGDEDD